MAIAGNLRTMQLSELLQWLSTGLKTGTLVVRGAPGEKRIYFNNGRVTSSSSTLEREHLGRFLVGFGFITEEELIRALEVQQESRILLGKILVMIGAIKEEELADLVRLKAAETIYDMFLWTEGSFAFIDGEIPSLPMVPISSDVTGIVMEGLRRYDEWQRIKTRIPTMRVIPAMVMPVEEELPERDKMILGATNGRRAIDQIALETHNPDFHVAKLIYDLMLTGHVMLVGEREETTTEPVFAEIEPIEEDLSSFDPLMSGDLHTIPESLLPAAGKDELRLAPPGPRTPVPTDFNQFLKRDSGATLSRRPAARPADSADTLPNLRTDKTGTPPGPGPAVKAPPAARTVAAAAPSPVEAPPAARAPASSAPAPAPAPASELLPRIPAGTIPVLGKPMEELMNFPFTPPEAFIVSRINGIWDVRSIARISPFPEAEVTRIFHKLHKSGVITFK
ncbi:MAG TPA: DUF4388 domain-containing protein [Thermoanaerobaculia bacterium]|jgi:hypothetical protein